jgi:hypothetical protein
MAAPNSTIPGSQEIGTVRHANAKLGHPKKSELIAQPILEWRRIVDVERKMSTEILTIHLNLPSHKSQ